MPFNSFQFLLIFLPAVAAVYAIACKYVGPRSAQLFLLLSSLFFYGYAKPSYVLLLLGSILFNWMVARFMGPSAGYTNQVSSHRKALLWLGLSANIIFLSCFKYINFFLQGLSSLHGPKFTLPDWELPLGISFFTLTQVMYLVDTYQGLNQPNSLFDHATLVSFFPYVSSGPLVRSRAIVPQFKQFTMPGDRFLLACRGLYLFAIGLAKKVLFADSFARIADVGFSSRQNFSTLEAWVFSLAYTFQIYFDFSGYSDMAVGAAWVLGIDIPQNFNAPYIAKSISEFWRRWHISLSNFITDYLYTPILRSLPGRKVTLTTAVSATVLAMGIAGLWHGPAWTFVIFGLLHGFALATNQIWKKRKKKMPDWLGWLLTFALVNVSFVFFRSPGIGFALHLLYAMLPHAHPLVVTTLKGVLPITPFLLVRPIVIGAILAFFFATSQQLAERFRLTQATAFITAALMLLSFYSMNSTVAKQFVYFAF